MYAYGKAELCLCMAEILCMRVDSIAMNLYAYVSVYLCVYIHLLDGLCKFVSMYPCIYAMP